MGGVGGFAAEALVRSGVGRVIVVDYDRICVTNINRQLHATKATLGKSKVDVMAERLRTINPDAVIDARSEFYRAETSANLLVPEPDIVIDAIDNIAAKMHLIATCVREKIRIVSAMGAAARLDPTQVRIGDLRRPASIRSRATCGATLRKKHGIDSTRHVGAWAVFSEETPIAPHALAYDHGAFRCVCPEARTARTTASTSTASKARLRSYPRCSVRLRRRSRSSCCSISPCRSRASRG